MPRCHPMDYRDLHSFFSSTANCQVGVSHSLLSPVLSKIEKQIQRENVIHAIDIGCVDELVEIPNFRQDLGLPTISDPGKSTVLIKILASLPSLFYSDERTPHPTPRSLQPDETRTAS